MMSKKRRAEEILKYAKKHNEHFFLEIHPQAVVFNKNLDEITIQGNGIELPDGNVIPYDLIVGITSETPIINGD